MRTRVCDMLGIEFPILAFTHCRDVVVAVSKAGGFGVLGAVGHSPEELEHDLDWIEEELGDTPYGVDLLIPTKYVGSDKGGLSKNEMADLIPAEHREFVDDILARYGVPELPPRPNKPSSTGLALTHKTALPLVDIALAHRIKLIANALGPPSPELIERAHAQEVVVAALAGHLSHAVRHNAVGADLIIAQGYEAGGHTGEIGSMVLIPEVVKAVSPTPVLGAGGIASGRQMAAAMALGAEGVWCGSVWLTTEEAETHQAVKEKFLAASSSDTVRSRAMTGKPARFLRTAWSNEWEREDTPDPLPMPLQTQLIARAQARIRNAAHREGSGSADLVTYFVGQAVGSVDKVKSARQVVFDMVDEYIDAVNDMHTAMTS